MRTVILCGGKGTRAWPDTAAVPKPLLPVAGEPVLGHVLRIYASQGLTQFVLTAGHLAGQVADFARTLPRTWDVEVVDTGVETGTAARIAGVRHLLDGTFLATYADGLGDIDLGALRSFHRAHGAVATLTTVALPSPFGTVDLGPQGRVATFREKPRLEDHPINAGYFVFDPGVFDRLPGPDLERDVLPWLADAGELYAYRHDGFWRSMDTAKDARELTDLARAGGAPWIRASVA